MCVYVRLSYDLNIIFDDNVIHGTVSFDGKIHVDKNRVTPLLMWQTCVFIRQFFLFQHVLADAWVVKSSELGLTEDTIHCRTYLGHLLQPGDTVLG